MMRWRSRWPALLALAVVVANVRQSFAQLAPNLHYDGRITLARLKYTPVSEPEACQGSDSPAGPGWGHDYPMSVQGLLKAATELTSIRSIGADSNLVLTIDDPDVMRHPLLMLTEPGCWDPTEAEAKLLREYLLKGGFLIADDFTFFDCSSEHCELAIERFERWIERVLPGARVVQLPASDPVLDGFFQVDPLNIPGWSPEPGHIMGIYKDNDPKKRLLAVGNYWTSLGQYWAYVDEGLGSGMEQGGPAYRLGLNYLLYGLGH